MAERDADKAPEPGAAGAPRGFFAGGDRRTHLEQLRHLSQWSRRVLLVTGPRGVGKSALYRQLSATLEPRAKAARINGALVQSDREVLHAVVQGFGLAAPVDGDAEVVMEVIAEHARAQERSDRFCAVLVDDAELLEARALEYLITLAADSPMRLVLFGEVRLVPAVERYAEPPKVGWFEIRLTGFDVDDVRHYLAWRFREQGHEGALPFSESQIKEIARLSGGLPGRVEQMGNVLLARIQSAGQGPDGRRFPALHRAVLAVLAVALGIAYLLWQPGGGEDAATETETRPLEIARDEAAAPQADTRDTTPREPTAAAAQPTAGDEDRSGRDQGIEPAAEVPEQAEPEPPAAEPERAEDAEPAPAPERVAKPVIEPQPASPEAPGPPDSAVAPADPEPTRADPEPTTEPDPEPAEGDTAAATPEVAAATPGGVRDASWIMRQPGDAFTLQLVSFSTADRAAAYLAEQSDPQSFGRFRLQRDGRILHVVIYGSYDSRAAAQQAATRLPDSVGGVQPWVRSYAQIQDSVRTALQ